METKRESKIMTVALEGNIASGKSYVGQSLHNTTVIDPRSELKYVVNTQLENIQAEMLAIFLTNQRKYAFGLQLLTLEERLNAIQHTRHSFTEPTLHLLDRSGLGDAVFAVMHHLNGNISDQEMQVYYAKARRRALGTFLFQQLNGLLYLYTGPSRCKDSLCKRDGVDKGTELLYLVDLDHLHAYAILKLLLDYPRLPVAVANWERYGKPEEASTASSHARLS